MKIFNVTPLCTPMITVDYLGGEAHIPENHQFIAMTKLNCANGETKGLLVSFEVEPTVSKNGYYLAVPGTDSRILGEVEYQDPRGSLRRVQGLSNDEVILANTEELVIKITDALANEQDPDVIHTIFCPEHGIFADFLAHSVDMLNDRFIPSENEGIEDQAPELPKELISILSMLSVLASADGKGRA